MLKLFFRYILSWITFPSVKQFNNTALLVQNFLQTVFDRVRGHPKPKHADMCSQNHTCLNGFGASAQCNERMARIHYVAEVQLCDSRPPQRRMNVNAVGLFFIEI